MLENRMLGLLMLLAAVGCHGLPAKTKTDHDIPTYTNKFLIVGDYGSSTREPAERVAAAMNDWAGKNGADFIVSMGDNFYQDGPPSVSDRLFDDRWGNVYTGSNIKDLFWFMSVGNHDYYPYEGYEWNEVLRTFNPGENKWYLPWLWYNATLDSPAGKFDLIVTDTQAARKNLNEGRTDMYDWFEDTMKWSEESNHMKIVLAHHPARAAGNYYPGSGTIQDKIEPLTVQYKADFFIHGHDHNMQHLAYKNGNGPEILVIGGGGAGLYGKDPDAEAGLDAAGFTIVHFSRSYGFAGCTIDEDGITIEYFDDDGDLLHSVTRSRRT